MSRRFAITVAAGLAAAVAAGGSVGAATAPGLTGKVLRGPTTPVCRADKPCYAPFKGTLIFTEVGAPAGTASVRTQSQADGDYTVRLEQGRYRVATGIRSRFGGLVRPAVVTVPSSGLRRINLVIDTGIR